MLEELHKRGDRGGRIGRSCFFGGMVTETILAADEEHTDFGQLGEDDAVVARAADEVRRRLVATIQDSVPEPNEAWRTGDGLSGLDEGGIYFESALAGYFLRGIRQLRAGLLEEAKLGMADVDGEPHLVGDDVAYVGPDLELADGGHEAGNTASQSLDGEDEFGRSGEGVMA
jgi:hypothetical protein